VQRSQPLDEQHDLAPLERAVLDLGDDLTVSEELLELCEDQVERAQLVEDLPPVLVAEPLGIRPRDGPVAARRRSTQALRNKIAGAMVASAIPGGEPTS
jgi:hypothetical protein